MPELPEVETIKRDLAARIIGLTIQSIDVYDERVIKDFGQQKFKKILTGKTIENVERRGKAIILKFKDNGFLIVQVKMTGYLLYGEKQSSNETKVIFKLSNGKYLTYNDQRTFGWLIVTDNLRKIPYLNTIGPEPLGAVFTSNWLKEHLQRRKTPIKTLLMNQHFLAGVGNIYASEILFSAYIHPQKPANRLKEDEVHALYQATVDILNEAIDYRGTSIRNYRDSRGRKGSFINRIKVYGRENKHCPRCAKPIIRIVQSGRSTFYCQNCQKDK